MPVQKVFKNGVMVGYRWGSSGKLYTVSRYGSQAAKGLALRQGRAVKANSSKRVVVRRRDGVVQRYRVRK